MYTVPIRYARRDRGAALIIVLAFVVLLTGLALAYFSRATSDRPLAQGSFHQSRADQVAASGMDLVLGGVRQEITGPSPTPPPPYVPASNAGMLPVTFGNPDPANIPNLIRRSVSGDTVIPAPGVASLASNVNSTAESANGRSVTLARWNKHYLVPKLNTGNDLTDPIATFVAPDWVIITRNGPVAFTAWNDLLKDATPANASYAVGRFAYAIYDEGQLLDANVVGYPTDPSAAPIPAQRIGRKGPVAFADLTTLPNPIPQPQIDKIAGWRNYGSTLFGASNGTISAFGTFPNNFTFTAALATNYLNKFILSNNAGFSVTNGAVAPNGRTDQMFLSRQQLIAYRATTQFNPNALQYLTTFTRELNAPSWKPLMPPGSSIDYASLANTPTASTSTAINRDLLNVPATGTFTRFDGTTANAGDLLIKQRFPLSRLFWITYKGPTATLQIGKDVDPTVNSPPTSDPIIQQLVLTNGVSLSTIRAGTAANVKACFGLTFPNGGAAGDPWIYTNPTGAGVATRILRLDEVAAANREPDFFELLKAGILSGSVGLGSGVGNVRTFVNAETKYYDTTNNLSADYQIMQIGANIIDQWDPDNVPTFIDFFDTTGNYRVAGIENLPYLNKLVFKPAWIKVSGKDQFAAWLLPSLWNPNQNAPPTTAQDMRIVMTAGSMTASLTSSGGNLLSLNSISAGSTMTVATGAAFGTTPSAPTAGTTGSDVTKSPDNYFGFHFSFATNLAVTPSNSLTAYPDFGVSGCDFELQVQVTPGVFKPYQKWTGCGPGHPLTFQPPAASWTLTTLQDPEFVTLDPRTVRFGVSGNDAFHSASPGGTDYTTGVLTTLDQSTGSPPTLTPVFEKITALPPQGPKFASSASTDLYKYANNADTTVYYTDLDGPASPSQRRGDLLSSGWTTAMLPANFKDRPQILNRPFQSLAELGQVFRDQPWKTLDFTTPNSPDVGLLDVLSLHDSANEGGKTSLNTRNPFLLKAILSNAITRLSGTGTDVITAVQRDNIVTALISKQPLIRKTDLLAQLANDASITSLGNKEARELVMRAFSDATQTRTWNLMIDVIAQSGRYPPNASSLAGFMVEGEQHYWVHVAVDRFTGDVVDKQIEVVNE